MSELGRLTEQARARMTEISDELTRHQAHGTARRQALIAEKDKLSSLVSQADQVLGSK